MHTMKELRAVEEQASDPERLQVGHLMEHREVERLESAVGNLAQMEQLRPEVWSGLTETEREWYLCQAGQRLSEAYECPAPPFIGSQMPEVDGGVILGFHSDSLYATRLNRELLKQGDVSEVLVTYCHEFRHAYQHEMVNRYNSAFRHLCHDETAAARWAGNLAGQYVSFETDPEGYETQPVEEDARYFAQRIWGGLRRRQSV
jgi:hypothetical protein